MTPIQSLAFLAITLTAFLCAVWLIAEFDKVILKRRTVSAEIAPVLEYAADDSESRPILRLVRGSTEPRQGPGEVYDWAVRGI